MVTQRKNKKWNNRKVSRLLDKTVPHAPFLADRVKTVKQFVLPAQGAVAMGTTTDECYSRQSKHYVNMTSSASNFSNFSGKFHAGRLWESEAVAAFPLPVNSATAHAHKANDEWNRLLLEEKKEMFRLTHRTKVFFVAVLERAE